MTSMGVSRASGNQEALEEILGEAVRPQGGGKIGSEFAAFGRRMGEFELEITRDQAQPEPAEFE